MSWYTVRETELNIEMMQYIYDWFFEGMKGKILDVGCSSGNFLAVNPARIQGIDVDKDAIKKAVSRGLNARYMNIGQKLGFRGNSFSGIFCSHVLEHLKEPLLALKEMHRVLRPGGKLCLMTPDIKKYGFRFWDLYDHLHPFTKDSLDGIVYDAGFRKYEIYHSYIPIRGQGYLIRNKILSIKQVILFHRALDKIGISGDNLVLEALK